MGDVLLPDNVTFFKCTAFELTRPYLRNVMGKDSSHSFGDRDGFPRSREINSFMVSDIVHGFSSY
jgi:hypothetical protein